MALQKDIEYKGLQITNCYFKVWCLNLNKNEMSFGLSYHKDAESPMIYSVTHSCAYTLDGDNPWIQAYNYLKTLPEFSDAVDC